MDINIYIGSVKLDSFDDENIEFVSSLQNLKDITKVTTDYSRPFTVPATDINNKAFKHFYNSNLSNGFDTRERQQGRIEFGGMLFKEGVWQLNSVKIKEGRPSSYSITFFSNVVGLKDLFEDLSLTDITTLSTYNFAMGTLPTLNKLITKSDLCYTLLSKREYYYNSTIDDTNEDTLANIFYNGSNNAGVQRDDLRPSIKLSIILNAIISQFSLNFTGDIFNRPEFTELYLALNHYDGIKDNNNIYDIAQRLPDIKIMEFLKAIINIFKLVIIYDSDTNTYNFQNINEYYKDSNVVHDITNIVDEGIVNIKRLEAPSEIKYTFKKSDTRTQKTFEANNNRYYGDLDEELTTDTGSKIVGKVDKFEIPFSTILLERLTDINTTTTTNVQYGLCADDKISNREKIPFIHYVDNLDLGAFPIAYYDGTSQTEVTQVNTPVFGSKVSGNYNFGCIFNNEFDTYNQNLLERNFFSYYHYEQVVSLYDKNNRILEMTAKVEYSFMLNLKLNDTIIYKGDRYRIEKYDFNLLSRDLSLVLFKVIDVTDFPFDEIGAYSSGFSNGFFK